MLDIIHISSEFVSILMSTESVQRAGFQVILEDLLRGLV
jgi:hypothetical protein